MIINNFHGQWVYYILKDLLDEVYTYIALKDFVFKNVNMLIKYILQVRFDLQISGMASLIVCVFTSHL